MYAELHVVVELVEGHILLDVLCQRRSVGVGALLSHSKRQGHAYVQVMSSKGYE
jgi:hypothetical protein